MSKISEAVILAAGMGTRIQALFKDLPKGFLKIGDQTLIDRSIDYLLQNGIKKIIIVTGYLSQYYEELECRYEGVSTVKNKIFADSGSMYSFYCARDHIGEDFLLLESDLIYEKRALTDLLLDKKKDVILVSGKTGSGDEVYVETSGNRIKKLSKKKAELTQITGELVGVSKISYPFYKELVKVAEKMFEDTLKVEYEQCIVETARDYPVHYLKIEDLVWAEIDDESHLKRVNEHIYPLLKE